MSAGVGRECAQFSVLLVLLLAFTVVVIQFANRRCEEEEVYWTSNEPLITGEFQGPESDLKDDAEEGKVYVTQRLALQEYQVEVDETTKSAMAALLKTREWGDHCAARRYETVNFNWQKRLRDDERVRRFND